MKSKFFHRTSAVRNHFATPGCIVQHTGAIDSADDLQFHGETHHTNDREQKTKPPEAED